LFYVNTFSYGVAVPERISFPGEEEKVLGYWDQIKAFETSLKLSEGKPEYSFYDGPPFATGLPHYGHILAGTIKVSSLNCSSPL
jgi:isoleucyl-tRNA synthetase